MVSEESRKSRERVEHMLERMNLTEKENRKLVVDDQEDEGAAPQWALVGKVLHRKFLHVNTIEEVLRPAWGNPRGLNFNPVGENRFVANLETQRDRDRIYGGGPWMVGKHAVILELFDSRARPSDWKFEKLQVWARVINLPFSSIRHGRRGLRAWWEKLLS